MEREAACVPDLADLFGNYQNDGKAQRTFDTPESKPLPHRTFELMEGKSHRVLTAVEPKNQRIFDLQSGQKTTKNGEDMQMGKFGFITSEGSVLSVLLPTFVFTEDSMKTHRCVVVGW